MAPTELRLLIGKFEIELGKFGVESLRRCIDQEWITLWLLDLLKARTAATLQYVEAWPR